jgi:esterase
MNYLSQFNHQFIGPEGGRRWIFLHGLMGYGANWRKITSGLEETERILIYDQRGHGRSIKPITGYAPEDFADDLHLITEEIGWDDFILVGHSMGGRNAMNFASRFPFKLKKLIIEDIGPDGDQAALARYQSLLDLVPVPFSDKKSAKDFFYNTFPALAQKQGRTQTHMLGQYLYSNLIEDNQGAVNWRFSRDAIMLAVKEGRLKSRWDEWSSLQVPTLIVRGVLSNELSHQTYLEMLKANSIARGVEIQDAGHWVHSDKPTEFLAALKGFVDSAG